MDERERRRLAAEAVMPMIDPSWLAPPPAPPPPAPAPLPPGVTAEGGITFADPNRAPIVAPPPPTNAHAAPPSAPVQPQSLFDRRYTPDRQPVEFTREHPEEAPPEAGLAVPPGPPQMPTGGGVVIPGGWRGDTRGVKVQEGIPVDPSIRQGYDTAAGLDIHAGAQQGAASKALFEHERDVMLRKQQAAEQAGFQHMRIQDERDRIVRDRMAEIEDLNKQAQGNPEDTFNSSHVLAQVIGAIAVGLGFASGSPVGALAGGLFGGTINNLVNQDISSKRDAQRSAGERAGRQINLLNLHRERLKDEDQAIEATKLAYYDSIHSLVDSYYAQHKAQVSEPEYKRMVADIIREREKTKQGLDIQEADKVTREMHEKNRPATLAGSGVTAQPGNVLTLPDGSSYVMPNDKQFNDAVEGIGSYNRLIQFNNEIADLRKKTEALEIGDYTQRQVNIAKLEDLEQAKLKAIETAAKQGVLREGEYERAQSATGHATTGLGIVSGNVPIYSEAQRAAANATIAAQTKRWQDHILELPRNMQGKVVVQGYMRNPLTGELTPAAKYTGQNAIPRAGLAPAGSKSVDPRRPVNTMPARSGAESTPYAPQFQYRPAASSKGKKK